MFSFMIITWQITHLTLSLTQRKNHVTFFPPSLSLVWYVHMYLPTNFIFECSCSYRRIHLNQGKEQYF